MAAVQPLTLDTINHPIDITNRHFNEHKYRYYQWLREEAPVYRGKLSIVKVYLLSRYDDCVRMLKDPRFVRNRSTITGGSRLPFPTPKSVALLSQNMILADEPEHRRLRNLVHKAFTPRALARLQSRIETLTHDLLDRAERQREVDLIPAFALPIPVTVISEMVGVSDADMPAFRNGMQVLSDGMSGWSLFRTFAWDLPRLITFVRDLIARKRADPQDDILTGLIQAEEQGEKLSEDELVSMVFLLIFAGYETTVHLIANAVVTLLEHPDQLARLRAQPDLLESAIEEVLRFNGPVQGTKMAYATEELRIHGVTIPRGATVVPLLGSANHDGAVFDAPEVFDIARSPNKHLGFGQGIHYCLGAPLARMETSIALKNLLERNPRLRLTVEPSTLRIQNMPLWHRYERVPVALG